MCICNDRRWPETYRVMGLQSVELVLLGYNTPTHIPWEPVYDHLTAFHNHLSMQAGAYQNSTWVVGVAKAGIEEGCDLIGRQLHRGALGRDRRAGDHQGRRGVHSLLRPRAEPPQQASDV